MKVPPAVVPAWQAALGAEQQAAFGYTLLGPHLPGADVGLARTDQAAHEGLRDTTMDAISAAGSAPQPPAGDYPALYPGLTDPPALAASLEDDCAAAWRYLYAVAATHAAPIALRRQAQAALTASAVRATQWRVRTHSGKPVTPFPGTG